MKTNLIVAMDRNGLIGLDGGLPWDSHKHFKREDMAWFRQHTMGKAVLMGRKTYESIGKPLKGRHNLVISAYQIPNVNRFSSLVGALTFASQYFDEIFVIGGAQVYKEALPIASKLYLTTLRASLKVPDGSTPVYFPPSNAGGVCNFHRRTRFADYRIIDLCPPSTSL